MVMIIVAVVFIALIGGMVFAVVNLMRKTDPTRVDTSTQQDIATAQEFLPFEDIRDGMIIMGNHKYRAVIEASSTNYNLKTDREKEMIEVSFQRFLNSLTFPITMYVQTRVMDNTKMLQAMQEELQEAVNSYPHLSSYANDYFNEMNNLNSYIGNNKQKKKYIIVPFEDVEDLKNLSDEEKYEHSLKELQTRVSLIVDGLSSVGVRAKMLNTSELAELIFSTYHKDNYAHAENVINGEFLTMLTKGEKNHMETISNDARLDWILYEAQMRIQNELMRDDIPDFIKDNFQFSIQQLDQLRDQTSGYYKQRDEGEFQGQQDENFELNMKKKVVIKDEKEELRDYGF
jgi:hypothetical protein